MGYLDYDGLETQVGCIKRYVQAKLAEYLPKSGGTIDGNLTVSGTITGNGVTPTAGDDSAKLATTEYVQEEIRTHANLPVGFEYFSPNPNIPQGSLPLFGGEYSRETYSALWDWVQEQTGYLKTESDWQDLSTAHNGNVPFYSSGDGSTTFRVPSLKCWVKGANGTVTEVGSYKAAGLPNIAAGTITTHDYGGIETQMTGAWNQASHTTKSTNLSSGSSADEYLFNFSASRSNSIYGNSTTVQPESIVGMWLVKAYGTIEDTGTIDEQQYIDDRIAALPTSLATTFLPLAGGEMSGDIRLIPSVHSTDWSTLYQYPTTITSRYGIRGTPTVDRNVCFPIAIARDASDKDSNDETCRYGLIEMQLTPEGNDRMVFRVYQNTVENNWDEFQVGHGSNGIPYLRFAGKHVERVNSSSLTHNSGYIRYESGLQICWNTITVNTQYSAGGYATRTWTYPVAFTVEPIVWCNSRHDRFNVGTNNNPIGTASCTIYSVNTHTSTAFTLSFIDCVAIGTWK